MMSIIMVKLPQSRNNNNNNNNNKTKTLRRVFTLLLCAIFTANHNVFAYQIPTLKQWSTQLKTGYKRRVAANPSFPAKSLTEVILAAGTQLAAECNRRGASRILPEIDFVLPAILSAIFGKYYSMWRVAKTVDVDGTFDQVPESNPEGDKDESPSLKPKDVMLWNMAVPTNAFQRYLMDGVTTPTLAQRAGSFIAPMFPLFRAGLISSFVAYGTVTILIYMRTVLFPSYVAATIPINVLHASIYTGCFMAIVSNIRYQLLQGIVEPFIDWAFQNTPVIRSAMIFAVRWTNGLIGSLLAISGMRYFGLQRVK